MTTHDWQKYSDTELLKTLRNNTQWREAAFAELYERYGRRILVYCIRVLSDNEDGHDIFQETFVRFYKTALNESAIENVPGLLIRIARNLCLNHKRNRKETVTIEEFDYTEYERAAHTDEYEREELLRLIALALEYLDFEYREAFVLRQYHELSYEEIAQLTNTTVTTVTNRIWRAKERIKKILAPHVKEIVEL